MKKLLSVFLCALFTFSLLLPATAADKFTIEDGILKAYEGNADTVAVPEGVVSIDEGVFYGKSFSAVRLPSTLKTIGEWAFGGNENLTVVTIPNSVEEIGAHAFDDSTALAEIRVEAGSKSFVSVNGILFDAAKTTIVKYPEARSAKGYTLPASVSVVGDGAFNNSDIDRIVLGDNVTELGMCAFCDCKNLTEITIGKNLRRLGKSAFFGCPKLAAVSLPAAFCELEDFVFDNSTGLKRIDVDPANETYASVDGVLYTKDMKTLLRVPEGMDVSGFTLPATVTRLEMNCMTRCGFTSLDLSNVTYIDAYTMNECENLTTVSLGRKLTFIGDGAFYNPPLTDVFYAGSESDWAKIIIKGDNEPLQSATIHYNSNPVAPKNSTFGEPFTDDTLPAAGKTFAQSRWGAAASFTLDDKGTLTISGSGSIPGYSGTGSPMYSYRDRIRRVILSGELTAIGENVFTGCSGITDVYFDGNRSGWAAFDVKDGNDCLLNALIHLRKIEYPMVDVHPLDDGEEVPDLDVSVCSFTTGRDGGSMTGSWRYAYGQIYAFDCFFTLTTGPRGGEYLLTVPFSNGDTQTIGFIAQPYAAYRVTYVYSASSASSTPHLKVRLETEGYSWESEISALNTYLRPGGLTVTLLKQETPPAPEVTTQAPEPEKTTVPEKPETTTAPAATETTTVPAKPETTTAPVKPETTTAPVKPETTTAPVKPETTTAPAQSAGRLPGDVNNDGAVGADDARLALRRSVDLESYAEGSDEFRACDVNKDNAVGADDARLILRASVDLEDPETWR